ncbi:hypothetical protein [Paracoccus marcusii]|uniref:hypothetical protein n=1 Tax=Paracoccus marcusii TaxID=59779 RepID=UPI0037368C18
MKRLVAAAATTAALMALSALPAAAGLAGMSERPDFAPAPMAQVKVERRAGDLFTARELGQRNLMADDVVSVTLLPSAGDAAMRSSRHDS